MTSQARPGPDTDARLTLRTLGDAGLYRAGEPDVLLAPGKPLALLIYLALTPGRRISREFLMDLLWADLEPERARNALRQSLFHLRRLVGEQSIPGSEELSLARPIDVDRDRFLAAVEDGSLEAAVEAYAGAFLPNFGTPGGAAFERWADLERDRLQTAFLRSAELLVRRRLNESKVKDAYKLARRVRDDVPNAESAWRLVLESAIVGRDFVSAAVEAQALESWAAEDGLTLEPATRSAIARARQVTPGATEAQGEPALIAELTGREREFSAITAAWDSARMGHARHLHLTAPAGLGKTRLLRDAVARLRTGSARVVELRGAPGDRDVPYAFAGDLALAIAALPGAAGIAPASASALIGLNPALSARVSGSADLAVGDEAHRRRIQALADLVQAVAYEQPFVLAIDDMHWVDPSSYRMLEGLFSRFGSAHILCLTASRPERVPSGESVAVLPLAPLTSPQVGSLVTALGAIPDGAGWASDFVGGLHAATRGSPLLILETLRLALDDAILVLDANGWLCLDAARLQALLQEAEALRHRVRSLPREEGWVLALLATIGTPLATEPLATATGRAQSDVAATLAVLERHGLVARADAGWIPAHDEIAEAVRSALEPAQQQAADRIIGKLLVGSAGADTHRLMRGVRHLVVAGDDVAVQQHFRAYARLMRERRDRRPFAHLAAELLGDEPSSPRVAALVVTLPAAWRAGLWNRSRQFAAAVVIIGVAASAAAMASARAGRDASLQSLFYADSATAASAVTADPSEWDGRTAPVVPVHRATEMLSAALAFKEKMPAVSPDGRSVAWTEDSGDSTTLDIWIRTPAGTRRLTHEVRDDLVMGWTPDGSALVGMTNRWTSPSAGNYDIAVFDTATGAARQITSGIDHDGGPFMSPDGTRIAFTRENPRHGETVCVVTFDAAGGPDCRDVGGHQPLELFGWSGLAELILTIDSAGTRPLVRYDWKQNEHVTLIGGHFYLGHMSPDRRWVVGGMQTEGIRGFRDWIVPIDRPAHARFVDRPDAGPGSVRWWEGRPDQSLTIDRIEFTDTSRSILPGITTRLGIRALSKGGSEIPLFAPVRWTSLDTLVATVDSAGDVHPRNIGEVTVVASLAGWRKATAHLKVRGAAPATVVDERWDSGWSDRWITFGDPRPVAAAGPGGVRAMWTHGDGTFPSFALSRRTFPAKDGLGIELRVSTPITRDEWQRMRTELVAGIDTLALVRGDQKKAPASVGRINEGCGVRYPGASGAFGRAHMSLTGGAGRSFEPGALADRLSSGEWWTLRIQLLPDGRCGIAINGRVIWLSPESIPVNADYRVWLGDESLGTQLLHGPIQAWTGVRTDIDWTRAPR